MSHDLQDSLRTGMEPGEEFANGRIVKLLTKVLDLREAGQIEMDDEAVRLLDQIVVNTKAKLPKS